MMQMLLSRVMAAYLAGTIVSFFSAGERILAACKPVGAAVWPGHLAATDILARAGSLPVENRAAKTMSRSVR